MKAQDLFKEAIKTVPKNRGKEFRQGRINPNFIPADATVKGAIDIFSITQKDKFSPKEKCHKTSMRTKADLLQIIDSEPKGLSQEVFK